MRGGLPPGELDLGCAPVCPRNLRLGERVDVRRRRTVSPKAVARQVHRDRCEPGPEPQLTRTFSGVAGQRAVGTQEDVLRDLLGVTGIAGDTKGNRVDPMLVLANEALEGAIQIAREEAQEVVVHRPVQHG